MVLVTLAAARQRRRSGIKTTLFENKLQQPPHIKNSPAPAAGNPCLLLERGETKMSQVNSCDGPLLSLQSDREMLILRQITK
jgi:hypothetical protein